MIRGMWHDIQLGNSDEMCADQVAIQTLQSSDRIWQINLNSVSHIKVKAMLHSATIRHAQRRRRAAREGILVTTVMKLP